MEYASAGRMGGEWNSANVGVTFTTEASGSGETGKIARTTLAEDGPWWLTLLMYGCETCAGDVQQDWDDGIVVEPHWPPI